MLPLGVVEAASHDRRYDIFHKYRRCEPALEMGSSWYANHVQRTALNMEAMLHGSHAALAALCLRRTELYRGGISRVVFNSEAGSPIERLNAKLDGILRSHELHRDGGPQ